jgi:hypothetical protein
MAQYSTSAVRSLPDGFGKRLIALLPTVPHAVSRW